MLWELQEKQNNNYPLVTFQKMYICPSFNKHVQFRMKKFLLISAGALLMLGFVACKKSDRSSVTGWKYNDQEWGGFEKGSHGDLEMIGTMYPAG